MTTQQPRTYLLPWPPSVNRYWRHVAVRGRPRTLISAAGRSYQKEVAVALRLAGVVAMVGPVACHVEAHPPDRRRRDADNLLKATLDALTGGGAWLDDSQVRHLSVTLRRPAGGAGYLHVTLTPWTED